MEEGKGKSSNYFPVTFQWAPPERFSKNIFSQSKTTIRSHACLLEAKLFSLCNGNSLTLSNLLFTLIFFSLSLWPFLSSFKHVSTSWPPLLYMASAVNGIWKVYPNSWAFDVGFVTWFFSLTIQNNFNYLFQSLYLVFCLYFRVGLLWL